MIICKEGVRFRDLWPEIYLIFGVIDDLFRRHGVQAVITSAQDSTHGANSLHYKGRALDLRTKHLSSNAAKRALVAELASLLGPDYDVILENVGGLQEHLHVEYDPR